MNLTELKNSKPVSWFTALSLPFKAVTVLAAVIVLLLAINAVRHKVDQLKDWIDTRQVEQIEKQVDTSVDEAQRSRGAAEELERQATEKGAAASEKDTQIEQVRNDVRSIDQRLQRERDRYAAEKRRAEEDKELEQLKQETCSVLTRLGYRCD